MTDAPTVSAADDLQARRIQTVIDHMRCEVVDDFEGVFATFDHPRYEVAGSGAVYDGREAVLRYFAEWRTPFPEQGGELISMRQAADAIICDFWITGVHTGPLPIGDRVIAPTGKSFRMRSLAVFEFPEGSDKLSCERVYYDNAAIWTQLGIG